MLGFLKKQVSDISRRKLVLGSALAFSIKIMSAALSYLMFVLLARTLSLREFGYVGFAFSLATFFSKVTAFGQQPYSIREIAAALELRNEQRINWIKSYSTFVFCVSSIGSAILLGFIGILLSESIYIATIILAVAFGIAELITSFQRGHGLIAIALLPRDVIWRFCVVLICMSILYWSDNKPSADFIIVLISVVLLLIVLFQSNSHESTRMLLTFEKKFLEKELFRTSSLFFGVSIVSVGVPSLSAVIIGTMLPIVSVGPFFAALKTAQLMNLLLLSSNIVASPIIARQFAVGNVREMEVTASYVSAIAGTFALLVLLLFVFFGTTILEVFGENFSLAYPELIILGFGYCISAFCGPNSQCLQMTGKEKYAFSVMSISSGVTLALLPAVILFFGTLGAAVAVAIYMVGWNIWATAGAKIHAGIYTTCLLKTRFLPYVDEGVDS